MYAILRNSMSRSILFVAMFLFGFMPLWAQTRAIHGEVTSFSVYDHYKYNIKTYKENEKDTSTSCRPALCNGLYSPLLPPGLAESLFKVSKVLFYVVQIIAYSFERCIASVCQGVF